MVEHASEDEVKIVTVVPLHRLEKELNLVFQDGELVEVVDDIHALEGGHRESDETERKHVSAFLIDLLAVEDCLSA